MVEEVTIASESKNSEVLNKCLYSSTNYNHITSKHHAIWRLHFSVSEKHVNLKS